MDYYAGIDVSLELSSVCVVDATGKIRRELKVPSEPEALVQFFQQLEWSRLRLGSAWRPGRSPGDSTPVSSGSDSMLCCWRPGM